MDFGWVCVLGKRRYVQFNDKTRREKKNQREKIEHKGPQQEEEREKAGRIEEESAWAPNRINEGDRNSAVSELRQTQLTTHYLSARHWPLSPWSHLARAQVGRQDGLTWWPIAVITVVVNRYQQNRIKKKKRMKRKKTLREQQLRAGPMG